MQTHDKLQDQNAGAGRTPMAGDRAPSRLQGTFWWIAAIAVLAMSIRFVYVQLAPSLDPIIRNNPLYGDASGYHLLAVNLLKGWGLSWDGETPTSFRMPGYPAFLALIYGIAGPEAAPVRLVQALLGALTCIPIYLIARRLGGWAAAVLAGLGVALHPILIYMTGWVYSETLFLLLAWTGIWLVVRAVEAGSYPTALSSGLLLGLATLVRPEIVLLPAFVLFVSILLRSPGRNLRILVVTQLALLAVVLPWTARNVLIHKKPVLLTTNTGAVFYGGNNANANGGFYLDVPFVLPGYSEADSNVELTRRAVRWIRENPTSYLALIPVKLYKFFAPTQMEHSGSPLGRWTLPVDLVYAGFLILALWGGVVAWRSQRPIVILLMSFIAWYGLIAIILYGGTRVALPIAPGLMILAASALGRVWERRGDRLVFGSAH